MKKGNTYEFVMLATPINEDIDEEDFMDYVEGLFDNGRFVVTVVVPDEG